MTRSVYEVQRDFALSSGLRSEIIWDALAPDQGEVLMQKIEHLISGNTTKQSKTLARRRQKVFDNVWRQRRYTNRMLLSAIIYVLVTPETDPELALHATSYSCHPVIRTRKCVREDSENSDNCCMIFIDEHGRVYANWRQYVYNNTLPKGTMIAPCQGIYRLTNDEDNGVHLMVHATPASKRALLKAGDALATVGGLAASVPVAAALALPVAPTILLAATVVGVTAAAYSTVRSVSCLNDRRQHGQSISLLDNESRNSWLGVAGGVVGLGAAGASTALSVARTEVNAAAQLAVKGINVSSIVLSGTGVANGVYDLYLKISDDQPFSSLDVLQIAASLVIFTHSINNLRLAKQATDGQSLRHAVSNQTRQVFGQIAEESAKLHSDCAGQKFDMVRTLNDIPFKEALLGMHKIHKHLSEGAATLAALSATLISQDPDGQVHINVDALTKRFGEKFVQHIGHVGSLLDVLDALAKYFGEQSMQLLLQLVRKFLEEYLDGIERSLNTFLSTESVLYRILMQCINNYENFTFEFLVEHRDEILTIVSKYFEAMQPIDAQSSRRIKCDDCQGVYYTCDI
ncbi:uncharacterized protein LOC115762701 [Drosophila novamexicana]|uniref:uncharacterized protein LOC115762701 n=1 Tax=Drosophila novamexicana TaxID=47314 RepID=UPI0011E5994D|nr:uncharacterized protein LOC115762701 [Drosophila novamexicana]